MPFLSTNPATEELIATYETMPARGVDVLLDAAVAAQYNWRRLELSERIGNLVGLAQILRSRLPELARGVTAEMGKPIQEAEAEVNKCASTLEWFAEHGVELLSPRRVRGTTPETFVQFVPLGVLLAIMPWNYPLWQFFRASAPALLGGNAVVLKPAPNVVGCALATTAAFEEAGFPQGLVSTLLLETSAVANVIADPRVAAVTLTGSPAAGASVASASGAALKKCVLELGGSDPFIVLDDADVRVAAAAGCISRYRNAGQACVAAKRFIVDESVIDDFTSELIAQTARLTVGDPTSRSTQVGPLARPDLVANLRAQLTQSVEQGAEIVFGGQALSGPGYYFQPTIVTKVSGSMPTFNEETFGPLAAIIEVNGEEEALRVANASPYGLGCSIFTADSRRGSRLAAEVDAGVVFVNGVVASDPRMPFGGIKRSGFGRELSEFGVMEFMNIQTVWVKS
jgi:succinate-semialdehyde dehydrogenase / glutarate-semialdehyde dehydrogenase